MKIAIFILVVLAFVIDYVKDHIDDKVLCNYMDIAIYGITISIIVLLFFLL